MKTARAVIGANYGDEGKGLAVDYLCGQGAGVVVRYNGGAQAGHTVVTPDGLRHVFQHVGSGAFLGVPTYLSQFFVCNPIAFDRELSALNALGVAPSVFASPQCFVTTFADMMTGQAEEAARGGSRHGSTGMGFNATLRRCEVPNLTITMADLWNRAAWLPDRVREIATAFVAFLKLPALAGDMDAMIAAQMASFERFANAVAPAGIGQCSDIVFEGAQGLLLDMDSGGFPHVTRSNTGMQNIAALCKQAGIEHVEATYVSRTYLTRHGAGPLAGEWPDVKYHDDTNVPNDHQGAIRFAPLDDVRARCATDFGKFGSGSFRMLMTHADQLPVRRDFGECITSVGPTRNDIGVE